MNMILVNKYEGCRTTCDKCEWRPECDMSQRTPVLEIPEVVSNGQMLEIIYGPEVARNFKACMYTEWWNTPYKAEREVSE